MPNVSQVNISVEPSATLIADETCPLAAPSLNRFSSAGKALAHCEGSQLV
jgi:hypothetical protein